MFISVFHSKGGVRCGKLLSPALTLCLYFEQNSGTHGLCVCVCVFLFVCLLWNERTTARLWAECNMSPLWSIARLFVPFSVQPSTKYEWKAGLIARHRSVFVSVVCMFVQTEALKQGSPTLCAETLRCLCRDGNGWLSLPIPQWWKSNCTFV